MSKKQQLQVLKVEWYKKLKESGFRDIEKDERYLRSYDNSKFSRLSVVEFQENQRYWQLAGQLLHHFQFKTEADRTIWRLYVEGMLPPDIAKTVDKHRTTVNRKIMEIIREGIFHEGVTKKPR